MLISKEPYTYYVTKKYNTINTIIGQQMKSLIIGVEYHDRGQEC